ncbi:hypothetical protein PRIPAC_82439 [Pristionchus pacificus]|uniref:ShKT domain-containing protein n=1 Tax=Pristionchus pacificus TaxID=54126 RepID=A0A2A6CJR7_PRIPA|nr:hypothetical protein PRIPAC_82439 [Pristionchus pacificus]|eukprot:PDM78346.1 hypothetical protein PRIPAC_30925 [Pristionchus pacificus]
MFRCRCGSITNFQSCADVTADCSLKTQLCTNSLYLTMMQQYCRVAFWALIKMGCQKAVLLSR